MNHNPALADVHVGDEMEGFYLLTEAAVRTSANGGRFLAATIADRSGSLDLKMWDYSGTVGTDDCGNAVWVRGIVRKLRAIERKDEQNVQTETDKARDRESVL